MVEIVQWYHFNPMINKSTFKEIIYSVFSRKIYIFMFTKSNWLKH